MSECRLKLRYIHSARFQELDWSFNRGFHVIILQDAEFVVYQNYSSVWNVTRGYLNIFPTLIQETPESGISQHQIRNGRINIDQKE